MNVCPTCNSPFEEGMNFCPNCGNHAPSSQQIAEKERQCLYVLRRNLRHERTVWAVFAGVYIFYLFFFTISQISTAISYHSATTVASLIIVWFFLGPATGISLYQTIHLTQLEKSVHSDCSEAVQRAKNVRHIVLGALFNETSWIFAMLNLIHVKNNQEWLNKTMEKQRSNI